MSNYSRRKFIQHSALASTALLVPNFLKGFQLMPATSRNNKVLVIIQLSGGNDGLNTVVPYRNDIYYSSRPTLSIPKSEVLNLNDELGLNGVMDGLKSIYDDGNLTVLNNVGYPNPDRSHFRSMDIWQTGSASNEYLNSGWIGRYLDAQCKDCNASQLAIEIDDTLSLALKGAERNGIACKNPHRLYQSATDPYFVATSKEENHDGDVNDNLHYLYKTLRETQSSAGYIYNHSKIYQSNIDYPDTEFAKDLKTIAQMIVSDIDTKVFYVSLGTFDTHVNQKNQQEKLLKQLSDGLKSFTKDLKQNSRMDDVMVMTFSEFGRRVKQNASNGTDHGTANNIFLINGKLKKPGVFNSSPNLADLDNGDLKHQIDFRQLYDTLLKKWLSTHEPIMPGNTFDLLDLV